MLTRLLATYPCRAPSDFRLVKPAYMQAMEKVSQYALFEAERRINQNALGHGFMPSPSELRGQIDHVMEPFLERERRARAEAKRYAWPREIEGSPRLDEAARARIRELHRQYRAWREVNHPESTRAKAPPKPPRQIPDYSEEQIEITDALRRALKAKEAVTKNLSSASERRRPHEPKP
ncbi:hypothetical protein RGR602_CH01945 [Rhizobium gallicum bv. gallicum R602sp]|uniref:Uncharacterized protein n=1 Tax=Rhizobium gallicum bv. gallicum R602sp TaxID=1041138 RepID=A0A0B4X279_9HYPH|nr:hypothetical protein RGR602_CH01945 [Rhizobium gallicum bv. gallicum R602sp]